MILCSSLTRVWLNQHSFMEKVIQCSYPSEYPERTMSQNPSKTLLWRLHCASGEAVQADSRIHKGGGKKSLKSELQFLWGSAEIKISCKLKHFHLTENCQYFLFRHYHFFFINVIQIQNKTSTPCRTKCLVFNRTLHSEIGPSTIYQSISLKHRSTIYLHTHEENLHTSGTKESLPAQLDVGDVL